MEQADPLARLRDIHLPPDPSWWPPALGWWLVFLAVMFTAALLVWWLRRPKRQRYRMACDELRCLRDSPSLKGDTRAYAVAVSQLLKRYAMAEFGRERIAALSGQQWQSFLQDTGALNAFADSPLAMLADVAYQPGIGESLDRALLTEQAFAWLRACQGARHV